MRISCLLLAAGDSSRMNGINKLMLNVNGIPLVARTLKEIQKVPLSDVIVVTGHQRALVEAAIEGLGATAEFNEQHLSGMHSSIRAGLRALREKCDAFIVCLADQPYFDHRHLELLTDTFVNSPDDVILAPTFAGRRGHPVLISSKYIPEILEEPDGDYGCSYLFKRHPEKIISVEVGTESVLLDVDKQEDYEKFLNSSLATQDPVGDFFAKIIGLRSAGEPFVIASVIEVLGAASARVGSKAVFDRNGRNLIGWIGGGCAERFIGQESIAAIEESKPRIVLADLDDEIFGLGVACGGSMRVFIDPILPSEFMRLPAAGAFRSELRTFCGFYGWQIRPDPEVKAPESIEDLLSSMALIAARTRGRTGQSLRITKNVPAHFVRSTSVRSKQVTIVGRTRITEALARHLSLLSYDVRVIGPGVESRDYPRTAECHCLEGSYGDIEFRTGEVVIVASHTSQDPELVRRALEARASHVAMVGSLKRAKEVLSHLGLLDREVNAPLFVPAGLDIDAKNPEEIALSIVAEVLEQRSVSV